MAEVKGVAVWFLKFSVKVPKLFLQPYLGENNDNNNNNRARNRFQFFQDAAVR